MSDLSLVLARVNKAKELLSQAGTAMEAKKVADMAFAAKVFAIKQNSLDGKQFAHSVWIEALRLEGQFLEQNKNEGGRPAKTSTPREQVLPSLKSQGISRKEMGAQLRARFEGRDYAEDYFPCS